MMNSFCNVCGSDNIFQVFKPKSNQPLARYDLNNSYQGAISSPRYEINIYSCSNCGHFFNLAFNSSSIAYTDENIQEGRPFSFAYNNYQKVKAKEIKERCPIECGTFLEIGCGDGVFLKQFYGEKIKLLCYEPSPESEKIQKNNIKVFNEYFIPEYSIHKKLNPSFIIMRHVLEHVDNPKKFVKTFFSMLKLNESQTKMLYIEVPSNNKTVQCSRFSDFYYDHASYFTLSSLSYLLTSNGFYIEDISLDFNGEIISCLATINDHSKVENNMNLGMNKWRNLIEEYYNKDNKVIFWGTAGTGTMFLNLLGLDSDRFPYVIDSDTRKQGKYVPGTGQLVVNPEFIKSFLPDVVVILSQLHSKEISDSILELIGKDVQVLVINES